MGIRQLPDYVPVLSELWRTPGSTDLISPRWQRELRDHSYEEDRRTKARLKARKLRKRKTKKTAQTAQWPGGRPFLGHRCTALLTTCNYLYSFPKLSVRMDF